MLLGLQSCAGNGTRMAQLLIGAERRLQWTCQDIQIPVESRDNTTNMHCMRCICRWLRGNMSIADNQGVCTQQSFTCDWLEGKGPMQHDLIFIVRR